MSNINKSLASSTPRAERGSVIKINKQPVSLDLGQIVEDKEEVRIKDILDEMNLMSTNGQIGTQNEESSSGGAGSGNGLNQLQDIFDMLKKMVSTISSGNTNENKKEEVDPNSNSIIDIILNILTTTNKIPQFTNIDNEDFNFINKLTTHINSNIKNPNSPFEEFILEVSDLLKDVDNYLDSEFKPEEKIQIIKNMKIHDFFDDLNKNIADYSETITPITIDSCKNINRSAAGLKDRIIETERMIKAKEDRETAISEYNIKLEKQRELYKSHVIETELAKLAPNPTEKQILHSNDYDKYLDLLRKK